MVTWKYFQLILSFIGSVIAATIYIADKRNVDLPCSANGGCSVVASSSYSHISFLFVHDLPVAAFGLFGYVLALTIALWRLTNADSRPSLSHKSLLTLSFLGFSYSWYLQYVAHFVIGAFCVWCFSSAVTMTLLFCATLLERRKSSTVYLQKDGS